MGGSDGPCIEPLWDAGKESPEKDRVAMCGSSLSLKSTGRWSAGAVNGLVAACPI